MTRHHEALAAIERATHCPDAVKAYRKEVVPVLRTIDGIMHRPPFAQEFERMFKEKMEGRIRSDVLPSHVSVTASGHGQSEAALPWYQPPHRSEKTSYALKGNNYFSRFVADMIELSHPREFLHQDWMTPHSQDLCQRLHPHKQAVEWVLDTAESCARKLQAHHPTQANELLAALGELRQHEHATNEFLGKNPGYLKNFQDRFESRVSGDHGNRHRQGMRRGDHFQGY